GDQRVSWNTTSRYCCPASPGRTGVRIRGRLIRLRCSVALTARRRSALTKRELRLERKILYPQVGATTESRNNEHQGDPCRPRPGSPAGGCRGPGFRPGPGRLRPGAPGVEPGRGRAPLRGRGRRVGRRRGQGGPVRPRPRDADRPQGTGHGAAPLEPLDGALL